MVAKKNKTKKKDKNFKIKVIRNRWQPRSTLMVSLKSNLEPVSQFEWQLCLNFLKMTEDVKSASDAQHRIEMITLTPRSHWQPCRGRSWVRELECLNEGIPPLLPPEKARRGDWEFHQGNTFGVKSTFPPSPKHWHHLKAFQKWIFTNDTLHIITFDSFSIWK